VVVVSCGAANSARLLLMSANDRHLAGLANGSGQVGATTCSITALDYP
jgi:choline dehydrogenase-like flavoprotein